MASLMNPSKTFKELIISRRHVCFNIQDSINIINHINKNKKKNYMFISKGAAKSIH